jgi:hypothetical protein
MRNRTALCAALLAGTIFAPTGYSQTDAPPDYYHLDFVVKELDGGKVLNSRTYSTTVSSDKTVPASSIRVGSRVPVSTSSASNNPLVNTQFTYVEVGVNIDCHVVKEVGNQLTLSVSADVSGVADLTTHPPVIRNNKWTSNVIVPLKKPITIFSSDDPASKHQMQLELTATAIK